MRLRDHGAQVADGAAGRRVADQHAEAGRQRIRRHVQYYLVSLYYRGFQSVDLTQDGTALDVYERTDFFVENQFRKSVEVIPEIPWPSP